MFVKAHPVLQAAWAHFAFVAVHPFADGNGRVPAPWHRCSSTRAGCTPARLC